MIKQARALESAQNNAENYSSSLPQVNAVVAEIPESSSVNVIATDTRKYYNNPTKVNYESQKCYYCGNKRHKRCVLLGIPFAISVELKDILEKSVARVVNKNKTLLHLSNFLR